MSEKLRCSYCGLSFEKETGQANRQRRLMGKNVRFFCTRRCCGLSRRTHKQKRLRVAEKAAYDRAYRARHRDRLKAEKAERFRRTYDPAAARVERRARRKYQRAYARAYNAVPAHKRQKAEYDRRYRAAEYGAFNECQMVLVELEKAVRVQPWYERAKERGYFNNGRSTIERKRDAQISRW